MQVLITGAGGFVGRHLTQYLLENGAVVHGTALTSESETLPGIDTHVLDLTDEGAVLALIEKVRPDAIYHLAGQAFVPRSFEDPWETMVNNIRPQLNLFQACLTFAIKPRFLVVSSAEIYGAAQVIPIGEEAPLLPSSPYSVSKITQDMLGLQYYLSHQLPVMRARAFNHIGPGQNERFVAPAFALQIARIEAGMQEPVLHVGDLSARRDFTDVRDIVRAYRLIMEQGQPGEVYNIASGEARSIQSLLDILLTCTEASIEVWVDPARLRPNHVPVLQGDNTKLRQATGWQPQITFEQTLRDVLNDCRRRVEVQRHA